MAIADSHIAPSAPPRRHRFIFRSFVVCVLAPTLLVAGYLLDRAAPQYASHVGFTVRSEEATGALEMLGGLTDLGGGTGDADILYEFLTSQGVVALARQSIDLAALWSIAGDPFFSLWRGEETIEGLHAHWQRKVRVYFDPGTGLIEVRVLAFSPEGAQALAQVIHAESTRIVNTLTFEARRDAILFAREDLAQAEGRLAGARSALAEFRSLHQIVDPEADLAGQMGLLASLQTQLAEALIELDIARVDTRDDAFRIAAAERRVSVIEGQIVDERRRIASGDSGTPAYPELVGHYERLALDVRFAEETYGAARAALDGARAEARRQTRYLATFQPPTLAERSEYPKRPLIILATALVAFGLWLVAVLLYYAVRDRR
ncbi:MAG: hypothetical protein AAF330_07045 [Pseudomonadota bacterium]